MLSDGVTAADMSLPLLLPLLLLPLLLLLMRQQCPASGVCYTPACYCQHLNKFYTDKRCTARKPHSCHQLLLLLLQLHNSCLICTAAAAGTAAAKG